MERSSHDIKPEISDVQFVPTASLFRSFRSHVVGITLRFGRRVLRKLKVMNAIESRPCKSIFIMKFIVERTYLGINAKAGQSIVKEVKWSNSL